MSEANILLCGIGWWGKNWIKTVQNSKYDLWGVVDPNPSIEVDVPLYNSVLDIPKERNFTHAIIATPVKYHFDTYTFLVDRGIKPENILVEKPCGLNYEQVSIMRDSYPGYIFLHDPIYKHIKDNIDKLGKILSFKSVRASMGPRIRTDVNIISDYMIHDLYIFLDLFRKENINIEYVNDYNHFYPPIQSPSEASVFLKQGTRRANFFSSWWYPQKERKIVIIGEKGSFVWENDKIDYVKEFYKDNFGHTDLYGNVNYRLVKDYPAWQYRNNFSQKSNLELELEAFIEGKKPFSDNLILDVWDLIEKINSKIDQSIVYWRN